MSDKNIKCAPNGPLLVSGGVVVKDKDGNSVPYEKMAALCRCGESSRKPFCDGAHSKMGFSDKKESDGSKNKKREYRGEKLTVFYNKELCSHAAQCVAGSPDVFNTKAKPWIQPDNGDAEKLKDTIKKCPSGALTFVENGQETVDFGMDETAVLVAEDGPYYVSGSVALANGGEFAKGASKEHYALCRCGKSRNKPFCDGYHHDIGFKAP